MSELLKITNVTKKYHHFKALNNVSMTLESGKIIGLLGPNGSGKTTTINSIMGMLKVDQGEIKVLGKNILEDVKVKEDVGYVGDIPGFLQESRLKYIKNLSLIHI